MILKPADYLHSLWKNGRGSTRQMVIFPHQASLAQQNFEYRVSSAVIKGESPFSCFPGYQRWLVVLSGPALQLNDHCLQPLVPHHFSGEAAMTGVPLGPGEILDFGIIYRPELWHVTMEVWALATFERRQISMGPAQQTLCFAWQSDCQIGRWTVQDQETLFLDQTAEADGPLEVQGGRPKSGYLILSRLNRLAAHFE